MKKILASLGLAIGFTFLNILSFEYVCITDEYWPSFLGFPFVQSTDSTWVNSMSGTLYLKGLIGNVLFWSLIFYGFIYFINLINHNIFKRIATTLIVILCILSLLIVYFEIFVFDWRIQWDHDNFKMNYYQQDLDCKRTFRFFD